LIAYGRNKSNNHRECSKQLTTVVPPETYLKKGKLALHKADSTIHVNFPRIAKVARKWLCVGATSTASERVFSDCGLVVTAKRTRLSGFGLRDQVLVRRNLRYVECNEDDIINTLKD